MSRCRKRASQICLFVIDHPYQPPPIFLSLTTLVAVMLITTGGAVAQQRGGGTSGGAFPGPAARERNRGMDEYDRELNRLRNGAKISNERRRSVFPQINEDFQRIQVIHNELVRMVQADKSLNYDRLMELTGEMKKRSNRLRANLGLPDAQKEDGSQKSPSSLSDGQIKESVIELQNLIVSFVKNPIFQNLGLLDAKSVTKASGDLRDITELSETIKKSAETLNKANQK